MLTTFHKANVVPVHYKRHIETRKPSFILDYNMNMRAVDRCNMFYSSTETGVRKNHDFCKTIKNHGFLLKKRKYKKKRNFFN